MKQICVVPNLENLWLRLAIFLNWKLEECYSPTPTKFK